MSEWGVVTVLIAVAGLFATVGAPVLKLNSTITQLKVLLDDLRNEFNRSQQRSHETHTRLWQRGDYMEERLNDHESRITRLEEKEGQGWT